MQTKFIELNSTGFNLKHNINPIMICNITDCGSHSTIYTIGGQVIEVKETPQEIKELIQKSETFNLITK